VVDIDDEDFDESFPDVEIGWKRGQVRRDDCRPPLSDGPPVPPSSVLDDPLPADRNPPADGGTKEVGNPPDVP
jgi:hypothetical protein